MKTGSIQIREKRKIIRGKEIYPGGLFVRGRTMEGKKKKSCKRKIRGKIVGLFVKARALEEGRANQEEGVGKRISRNVGLMKGKKMV